MPTWFVRDGDDVLFTPRSPAVFLANLRRDPRLALSIDEDALPYRKVTVQGEARIRHEPGDDDVWRDTYRAIATRYIPVEQAEAYIQNTIDQPRALIAVSLAGSKVTTWRMPVEDEAPTGIWARRYYLDGTAFANLADELRGPDQATSVRRRRQAVRAKATAATASGTTMRGHAPDVGQEQVHAGGVAQQRSGVGADGQALRVLAGDGDEPLPQQDVGEAPQQGPAHPQAEQHEQRPVGDDGDAGRQQRAPHQRRAAAAERRRPAPAGPSTIGKVIVQVASSAARPIRQRGTGRSQR